VGHCLAAWTASPQTWRRTWLPSYTSFIDYFLNLKSVCKDTRSSVAAPQTVRGGVWIRRWHIWWIQRKKWLQCCSGWRLLCPGCYSRLMTTADMPRSSLGAVRLLASRDWEDTTCPPHTVIVASPEPRWAALPRPGKEGLRGGGNDRGGELCAIVGDGGRSGWRLG
jgi:hypothetical protein